MDILPIKMVATSICHFPSRCCHCRELRAPIRFRWGVFAHEFVIHQLLPFSVPYLLLRNGLSGLRRIELLSPVPTLMLIVGWLLGALMWATIILFMIGGPEVAPLTIDVIIGVGMSTFRNVSVAVKIAYRSPFLERAIRRGKKTRQLRRSEEVIFGVLPAAAEHELMDIEASAHRLEVEDPTRPVVVRAQETPEGMR